MDPQKNSAVAACTFDKEFHDLVSDKENFAHITEKFLHNLIDDITLGVIFDIHRKFKTNGFCLDVDDFSTSEIKILNKDNFGQHKIKKNKETCKCPQCGRAFGASKIAGHLAQCMGLRKARSNSSRRASAINNKESENPEPLATNNNDDNDDDLDWSPGMKKKEKKKKRGNKIKKKKGLASYC